MTSPIKSFFEQLAQRGHVSWLEHERGRMRFEIAEDGCLRQWTLVVNDGDLEVSQGESEADAVVRADGAPFDRVVRGEENLLAAAEHIGHLELLDIPGRSGHTDAFGRGVPHFTSQRMA
jgi:hypothetical protein